MPMLLNISLTLANSKPLDKCNLAYLCSYTEVSSKNVHEPSNSAMRLKKVFYMSHKIQISYFSFLAVLLCLAHAKQALCQDSLLIETEISNECQGQHNLAAIANGGINGIKQLGNTSTAISDNPIFHFAIYNGAALTTSINKKYSIETGLFIEERSFSHGNNTMSNLVIFPKIKLGLVDTFRIGKRQVNTSVAVGDFWNEDFQDFIRFYNIDFHALEANFGVKNWNIKANVIGDLSRNIGLDLHELYKLQLQHRYKRFTNSVALAVNELFAAPNGYHPQARDYNVTFYSKNNMRANSKLEAQADFRINKADKISKALGMKYTCQFKHWLKCHAAIRYFDFEYNKGYASYKPRYRNGECKLNCVNSFRVGSVFQR
jgi:hypothetical protein